MKPSSATNLFIGRNLIELEEVSSTNDYAANLLSIVARRPPEGTAIVAGYQNSGRGQRGTSWVGEPGKNLTLSVILYPGFLHAQDQFLLNQAVSLGVHDFVSSILGESVFIKWPNDIYRKNKKLGGILIENNLRNYEITSSLVGIGINVNQYAFDKRAPNPTSFKRIAKRDFDLRDCLDKLFQFLEARYLQLKTGKHDLIRQEYLSVLYLLGKLRFFDTNEGPIRAKITGLSKEGKLETTFKNGEKKYFGFKEIRYQ